MQVPSLMLNKCDESATRGALTQLQRALLATHDKMKMMDGEMDAASALRAFRGQLLKGCVVSVRGAPTTAADPPPHPSTHTGASERRRPSPRGTRVRLRGVSPARLLTACSPAVSRTSLALSTERSATRAFHAASDAPLWRR